MAQKSAETIERWLNTDYYELQEAMGLSVSQHSDTYTRLLSRILEREKPLFDLLKKIKIKLQQHPKQLAFLLERLFHTARIHKQNIRTHLEHLRSYNKKEKWMVELMHCLIGFSYLLDDLMKQVAFEAKDEQVLKATKKQKPRGKAQPLDLAMVIAGLFKLGLFGCEKMRTLSKGEMLETLAFILKRHKDTIKTHVNSLALGKNNQVGHTCAGDKLEDFEEFYNNLPSNKKKRKGL